MKKREKEILIWNKCLKEIVLLSAGGQTSNSLHGSYIGLLMPLFHELKKKSMGMFIKCVEEVYKENGMLGMFCCRLLRKRKERWATRSMGKMGYTL